MKLWSNDYEWIMAETAKDALQTLKEVCGDIYACDCVFKEQFFPVKFFDKDDPATPVLHFDSIDDLINSGYKPNEICFCTD